MAVAFIELFTCTAVQMLLPRCEGTGKKSNSVLFASEDETLWPSDR